jgi:8-oxo-dGTP pyrophosphatase MutT (NUDIX family)
MGSADEPVDIVDGFDNHIRTTTRGDMRKNRLRHRGVFIAVVTTDGKLVIHQRAATKDIWPSYWDIAAGGVVAAGEGYEESARRELAEELGIEAWLTGLGGSYYEDAEVALFGRSYLARHDGPYEFRDGEVARVELVSCKEFEAVYPERRWCPDSISLVLPLLRAHMKRC